MFVTPYKFPNIEGALKIVMQLPLLFLEISMEQSKICFHEINQNFQKTYIRYSPIVVERIGVYQLNEHLLAGASTINIELEVH